MGLFGSKPPKIGKLMDFLNEADDAYMLAFRSRNIKPFIPYADPAVCTAVLQEILSGEDHYFGTSKLRKRRWEILQDDGRVTRVIKRVNHEEINCGPVLTVSLGDDAFQVWDVLVESANRFRVIRIMEGSTDGE